MRTIYMNESSLSYASSSSVGVFCAARIRARRSLARCSSAMASSENTVISIRERTFRVIPRLGLFFVHAFGLQRFLLLMVSFT